MKNTLSKVTLVFALLVPFASIYAADSAPPVLSNGLPSQPFGSYVADTVLSVDTDEPATCKYSGVYGTDYSVMPFTFTTTGGTSHSTTLTGLTANTSYDYFIRCRDIVGNKNNDDYGVSFAMPPMVMLPSAGSTYLSDFNTYSIPKDPRPALGVPYQDPVFSATITRVTDPMMILDDPANPRQGLRHEYSRLTAVNADNTQMVLTALGGAERGGYFVYNIAAGNRVMTIQGDGFDPTVMWHPTDPDLLIYRYLNQIRRINVRTQVDEVLMQFSQYEYISTREEGAYSDDWRYYAFFGYKPGANWSTVDMVVADLQNKTIMGILPNQTNFPDWIGISPSGQYVVTETKLYDQNMNFIRTLYPDGAHSDFAIDENGDEVLVYFAETNAQVTEFDGHPMVGVVRLRDGFKSAAFDTQWKWSGHISGLASRKHPGWVLVSTYTDPSSPQDAALQREVFWLKLDGSGEVKRIAHHHSNQSQLSTGDKDYFAEPQAASSWDGNFVSFASLWDGAPGARYDDYLVTGDWWAPTTPLPPDTTPPLSPTNIKVSPMSSSQINLSWVASTDNVKVTGYTVFRDGVPVAATSSTSFSNTGLSPATTYTYTVDAFDAAENVSTPSDSVSGTTFAADTTAPTVAITTPVNNTTVKARSTIRIQATSTDNVGVAQVMFYINGTLKKTKLVAPYSFGWTVPRGIGKVYKLQAKSVDAAGNVGSSTVVQVTAN